MKIPKNIWCHIWMVPYHGVFLLYPTWENADLRKRIMWSDRFVYWYFIQFKSWMKIILVKGKTWVFVWNEGILNLFLSGRDTYAQAISGNIFFFKLLINIRIFKFLFINLYWMNVMQVLIIISQFAVGLINVKGSIWQ